MNEQCLTTFFWGGGLQYYKWLYWSEECCGQECCWFPSTDSLMCIQTSEDGEMYNLLLFRGLSHYNLSHAWKLTAPRLLWTVRIHWSSHGIPGFDGWNKNSSHLRPCMKVCVQWTWNMTCAKLWHFLQMENVLFFLFLFKKRRIDPLCSKIHLMFFENNHFNVNKCVFFQD